MKAFTMRLMHMGKEVYFLTETITPNFGPGDLFIVSSASGETAQLVALAKNRQLPAAMAKVSRHGVPVAGVAVSIAILLIGSCLNYIIPNPQRVFVYVYSASVLPGMVPWFVILISQLRFRRAHKAAIASHPFRSILFPWANYVTMAFLICVLIGMYFNEDTRMSLFVGIIFMLVVTAIYKVFGLNRHGKAHKLEE